jgi:dTDP-4-dehydrorhamnose reductase
MLGRYVQNAMAGRYDVRPLGRADFNIRFVEQASGFFRKLGIVADDIIINCAAVLKCRIDDVGIEEAIIVNALFPHILMRHCKATGARFVHISTDSVFSGKQGRYTESETPDAGDVYGKTKALGEPTESTVIRTSIIGEEIGQRRSLLEWVRSQTDTINGFIDHYWNGLTCVQLCKVIRDICDGDRFWSGVRHVFSPDIVSKFELVMLINEIYELGLVIHPCEAGYCDRSLQTEYRAWTDIPGIREQISATRAAGLSGGLRMAKPL